ncbi:MAG: hypothetical protein R3336_03050 [Phycisphaeraceae bacterium]|nr:hypothetical protein [Phycisphaeraceae bacterium]
MNPAETKSHDPLDPEVEGPGEHDAHLADDDSEEQEMVDCPKCRESIWAMATDCPYCGEMFEGEAWQQEPATPAPFRWALGLALMLLLVWGVWKGLG